VRRRRRLVSSARVRRLEWLVRGEEITVATCGFALAGFALLRLLKILVLDWALAVGEGMSGYYAVTLLFGFGLKNRVYKLGISRQSMFMDIGWGNMG
jgi:hypothetical protein